MKNMLKSIVGIFLWGNPEILPVEDTTTYLIETEVGKYCGKIIYQNDVVIKLKIAKPNAVKILKANIKHITIAHTDRVLSTA